MIECKVSYPSHGLCCICRSRKNRTFRLPSLSKKDDKLKRYAEWVNFAAIEHVYAELRYYCVCEIHFEDSAFCNHLKIKLLRCAIPTLNPPIYVGPSMEDGTPAGPVELKPDTFRKIVHELMAKQESLGAVDKRRSKFLSTTGQINLDLKFERKENSIRIECLDSYQSKHPSGSEPQLSQSDLFCLAQDADVSPNINADEDPLGNIPQASSQDLLFHPEVAGKSPTNRRKIRYIHLPIKPKKLLSISSTNLSLPVENTKSPTHNLECSNSSVKQITNNNTKTVNVSSSKPGLWSSILRAHRCSKSSSMNIKSSGHLKLLGSSGKMFTTSDTCSKITDMNFTPGNEPKNRVFEVHAVKSSSPDVEPPASVAENKDSDDVLIKDLKPSFKQNVLTTSDSINSIMLSSSSVNNKDDERSDYLLAPNNSSFADGDCGGEEVISCISDESERKQDGSVKLDKKLRAHKKKKYYDPVLIDSVLDKMKLKKNGPVRIVTLEKKPDRLFKGFMKNKVVTLYKQKIKKNKKILSGNNSSANNKSTEKTGKVRKKRKCTCSIHCQRRLNGSNISPPIINVSSGVGVKFEGNAMSPHIMNIDPDLADEELFNVENVFNVSTILTNVHDRSQIEQLCQMLVESIFRLKNLNIEGTMARLQVYISQLPSNSLDKSISDNDTPVCPGEGNEVNKTTDMCKDVLPPNVELIISGDEVHLCSPDQNNCDKFPSNISSAMEEDKYSENELLNATPIPGASSAPLGSVNSINNLKPKSTNVKVKLSTFHDHSYIKHESNYIFEKPEYLVKLINIETYRHPKKRVKPLHPAASKREVENHKKTCQKLSNKITRLRDIINKKNKNIKSMHQKIKYLGNVVCQEKGIKRIKYPKYKENIVDKQVLINSINNNLVSEEQLLAPKKKEKFKKLKNHGDQLRIDSDTSIANADETNFLNEISQCQMKKVFQKNPKKNTSLESIDVLYENLIEEICCNNMQY